MQETKTSFGPKTITIKEIIVNHHTEEIDLPKCELTDEDVEMMKYFPNIKTLILSENDLTDKSFIMIC